MMQMVACRSGSCGCHAYDPGIRAWRAQNHIEPEWLLWEPPEFDGVGELAVPQQVIDAVVEAALPAARDGD